MLFTQVSYHRAEIWAVAPAITATFFAKQAVVYCTRERFCLFFKKIVASL